MVVFIKRNGWTRPSSLLEDEGLSYDVHMLNVSPSVASRVEVEAADQFIHDALAQDVPVAFLNRHRGKKRLFTHGIGSNSQDFYGWR